MDLHTVEQPDVLLMKPKELYNQIKTIATKRYGYKLPGSQIDLLCLQSQNNKTSILRDLCLSLGINLNHNEDKDYFLMNERQYLLNKIHQQELELELKQASSKAQQKKASKKENQKMDEQKYLGDYRYLPF